MKFAFFVGLVSVLFITAAIFAANQYEKDSNLEKLPYSNGRMTKLEYQGHSYVAWAVNFGGGLVHDPDCSCRTAQKDLSEDKNLSGF